jgi:hypothetical protein
LKQAIADGWGDQRALERFVQTLLAVDALEARPVLRKPRDPEHAWAPLRRGGKVIDLLFIRWWICFGGWRWRYGLGGGCGTPKLWRCRTFAGPKFGPFDCCYELAAHWCRRLYLLQRLAANLGRRGLSERRCRKTNDNGEDQ